MRAENQVWVWRILRFIALVCFLAAFATAIGWITIEHKGAIEALISAGLFFWCFSNVW